MLASLQRATSRVGHMTAGVGAELSLLLLSHRCCGSWCLLRRLVESVPCLRLRIYHSSEMAISSSMISLDLFCSFVAISGSNQGSFRFFSQFFRFAARTLVLVASRCVLGSKTLTLDDGVRLDWRVCPEGALLEVIASICFGGCNVYSQSTSLSMKLHRMALTRPLHHSK